MTYKAIKHFELDFPFNADFFVSNVHVSAVSDSKKTELILEASIELLPLEWSAVVMERARPVFLIALGVLSFFLNKPLSILSSAKQACMHIEDCDFICDTSKVTLNFDWKDFSKDLQNLLSTLGSNQDKDALIYSLLDRWRKAKHLSEESSDAPLYIEESILAFFHILELLGEEYSDEIKEEASKEIVSHLSKVGEDVLFCKSESLKNFITEWKKIYEIYTYQRIGVQQKILFLLKKLDLLNAKSEYFIMEAVKTRNHIAHGRKTHIKESSVSFPVFFPLIQTPFFLSEDIWLFAWKVIAVYLWIWLYSMEWDAFMEELPEPPNLVKAFLQKINSDWTSAKELLEKNKDMMFSLQYHVSSKRIASRSAISLVCLIVDFLSKEEDTTEFWPLIWVVFEHLTPDYQSKAIILIKNSSEKCDLRDLIMEMESLWLPVVKLQEEYTKVE